MVNLRSLLDNHTSVRKQNHFTNARFHLVEKSLGTHCKDSALKGETKKILAWLCCLRGVLYLILYDVVKK